jgi:hypothetical protein
LPQAIVEPPLQEPKSQFTVAASQINRQAALLLQVN